MLDKPTACQGCPLYGKGTGFVPDRPALHPDLVVLTDQPTYHDEQGIRVTGYEQGIQQTTQEEPAPLLGPVGYQLKHRYLSQLPLSSIAYHSVLKCRWSRRQELPPPHRLWKAVQHCTTHHLQLPRGIPVVAHGELPMWFQRQEVQRSDRTALSDWRGFAFDHTFVIGHGSQYFRDPRQREWADSDWAKLIQWLAGTWPDPIPTRFVVTAATTEEEIYDWFREATVGLLYCDTEYAPASRLLTLFGVGYRHPAGDLKGFQLRWSDAKIPKPLKAATLSAFRNFIRNHRIAGHNIFGADLPVLKQNWGISFDEYHHVDDSMLAHAIVNSEFPHSLGFCASLYSRYTKLKHLAKESFMDYNWGDVITGLETLEACFTAFDHDPVLRTVYETQSLPVARHLMVTKWKGIKVNQDRVQRAFRTVDDVVEEIDRLADCYCPGLNLDSPKQLMSLLYVREQLPIQKGPTRQPCMTADAIHTLREWWCDEHGLERPDSTTETWPLNEVFERIREGEHPILVCLIAHNYHDDKTRKYLKQLVIPE